MRAGALRAPVKGGIEDLPGGLVAASAVVATNLFARLVCLNGKYEETNNAIMHQQGDIEILTTIGAPCPSCKYSTLKKTRGHLNVIQNAFVLYLVSIRHLSVCANYDVTW